MSGRPPREYFQEDSVEYVIGHRNEFKQCNQCNAVQRIEQEECMFCQTKGFDPLDDVDIVNLTDLMAQLGNYTMFTHIEIPEG